MVFAKGLHDGSVFVAYVREDFFEVVFLLFNMFRIHDPRGSHCQGIENTYILGRMVVGVYVKVAIRVSLFMEKIERKSLDSYPLKSSKWKMYVDDMNVVWPHGEDELKKFLTHLNSISPNIKFTMELEENGSIQVSRCPPYEKRR